MIDACEGSQFISQRVPFYGGNVAIKRKHHLPASSVAEWELTQDTCTHHRWDLLAGLSVMSVSLSAG